MNKIVTICIGKNNYAYPNALNGCIPDAWLAEKKMTPYLTRVIMFLDSLVIKKDIRNEIRTKEILDENDILFITNSSHGTQVPDQNGDEANFYDEAIYWDTTYTDDEFKEDISGLKCWIVFANDACFSGDFADLKSTIYRKPRFIQLFDIPKTAKKRLFAKGAKTAYPKLLYFSGCGEEEYSYDAYINGQFNGAFSYYFWKAFDQLKVHINSYKDWYDLLHKSLPSSQYPQSPALETIEGNEYIGILSIPVPTSIGEHPVPETPIPVKLTWWQRFLNWIKNLFK